MDVMRYLACLLILSFVVCIPVHGQNLKEDARLYREEGYKLQSMGNVREALVRYQKAVQLDPNYVEVYNDLGVIFESMGKDEEAIRMYKKSLDIDPQYLAAYTNLAFFYEKKRNIPEASRYWQKRYELGTEGEYWREVSYQHMLALGTFPQIKQELQEKQAARLSRELVYKREQDKLKIIEEAKLHFDIGSNLFFKGDYPGALKEFETAMAMQAPDAQLKGKIVGLYVRTARAFAKQEAQAYAQEAFDNIKRDDFAKAGDALQKAMAAVMRAEEGTVKQ